MTWLPVGPAWRNPPAAQDFPCGCGAGPGEACIKASVWCADRGKCTVMVIGPDETTEPCGTPAVGIALIREGHEERMCEWHRSLHERQTCPVCGRPAGVRDGCLPSSCTAWKVVGQWHRNENAFVAVEDPS